MKYGVVCVIYAMFFIVCGSRENTEVIPAIDFTSQGQDFVTMLSQENYGGCVAKFDQTMQNGLPEPKLQEAWNTIQTQVGNFQKQIGVRQTQESGFDVVYVTCQFEKGKIDVKVVYNDRQEVTGLWFRPAK